MYRAYFSRHARNEEPSATEGAKFSKGWFTVVFGSSLVFWLLQLSAGPASTPDYSSWPSPQKWIAVIFNIFLWLGLLWWVFAKGGAEYLSRLASLGKPPFRRVVTSPYFYRFLAVVIAVSGASSLSQFDWHS
jgi:hypothetical protein